MINPRIVVEQAMNGQQAVEKVVARHNSVEQGVKRYFDLIFLDLHMPVLDGYKVSRY